MSYEGLLVEKKEYVLLKRSVNLSTFYKDKYLRSTLEKLSHKLENARVCSEDEMPKNVVRLNSKVTIASTCGHEETFQLVLPSKMTSKKNQISLFTEKGVSAIGRKEGQSFSLNVPSERNRYTIVKVNQQNKNIGIDMVL